MEANKLLVKKVVNNTKLKLILDLLISVLDCASLCVESPEIKKDKNLVDLNIR